MKTLYLAAWLLLTVAAGVSFLTGYHNAAAMLVFSLAALALVYGLALWIVVVNTRDAASEASPYRS